MGGLEISTNSAVLGENEEPIPGLWAIGEVAGGVHGNNRLGGNSLLDCVVFGRIAGQACAQYMLGVESTTKSLVEFSSGAQETTQSGITDAYRQSKYSLEEVAKHCTKDDCWIVLNGKVFDVSGFLKDHPGGSLPIMACAGRDATSDFNLVHPPNLIDRYAGKMAIGHISTDASECAPKQSPPQKND